MAFIQGTPREQVMLMPESLDEYVESSNIVRAVDAFLSTVPFGKLGFDHAVEARTGRPPYHPRDLMALLIWGYLDGTDSSRKLEKASKRNIEVLWLLRKLQPDFKTIADFRRHNSEPIARVLTHFIGLLGKQGLIRGELVAIDGSKFRASNGKDRNFNEAKLTDRIERLERSIQNYLERLERNDVEQEKDEPVTISDDEMRQVIERLRNRKDQYQTVLETMRTEQVQQVSLTDPDSRRMRMSEGANVCYNAQIAVDSAHGLIVTQRVCNEPTDVQQLSSIAIAAKEVLGVEQLSVVADRGYANSVELARCEEQNITPYVPRPLSKRNKNAGLFSKEDFVYDAENDNYTCPAGQILRCSTSARSHGRSIHYYITPHCSRCDLRSQCTRGKRRRIGRRADEQVLQAAHARAQKRPDLMKARSSLAEHPFGTIKCFINHGRFLTRGLEHVRCEFALAVLAFDLKRALSVLGMDRFVKLTQLYAPVLD
jgi:transposase